MYQMLLIYLTAMALCIWFGPKVSAVVATNDVETEVTNTHAVAGLLIGITPVLNIFFCFFGAWLMTEILKTLKAAKKGDRKAVQDFNRKLKVMFDEQQ